MQVKILQFTPRLYSASVVYHEVLADKGDFSIFLQMFFTAPIFTVENG